MVTTTRLRILRHKYRISLKELQQHCGLSGQYISQLEFGRYNRTPRNEQSIDAAFCSLIAARRASLEQLEREYHSYKGTMLQILEVESDEF